MSKSANHKAKKGKRHFCLYTVYDNQTVFLSREDAEKALKGCE